MATAHQPLLSSPKRPNCAGKIIIFITVTLVAVICLTTKVALKVTIKNKYQLSSPSIICHQAHNPTSCLTIISDKIAVGNIQPTDVELLQVLLKRSITHTHKATVVAHVIRGRINKPTQQAALADCVELMDQSRGRLEDSSSALGDLNAQSYADTAAWLSAVLTNHVTCLDGLSGQARSAMIAELDNLTALASTSLALLNVISPSNLEAFGAVNMKFPSWVTAGDRKLLEALPSDIEANVVVAKDGSGNYKTVQEAIDSAPDKGKTRYVIYVKKGTYKEKVEVGKKKKNVMVVGDGMDSTIITGSLNYVDGSTTFNSATFAAVGDGFMAQDIWFQNTAGPEKHQAVALRVGADKSVINRCRIDGYQDTLYAHSNRQFYRDSSISGTIDFVFGNAAVVFQNCKLIALKPMKNQKNMVTAQGRTDPNQSTATSIQNCQIIASTDLVPVKGTIPTYLGRPWKEYSQTVYLESYIEDHISPAGWSEWSGDFALKTLYYGEYMNSGPGAGTSKRVKWPGYKVITDANEAKKFTVGELIQGGTWLKSTGVAFTEGL